MKRFDIKSLIRVKVQPKLQAHETSDEGLTKSLQILQYRDEILYKINNNHVTIISAGTGCGKTTQVPQFILDDATARNKTCNVIISQPRKIAAIMVARRVASERNCSLGGVVGYQVGLDKKLEAEHKGSRLMFCTTGVVLQKMIMQKSMVNYTHVILDEIHEREIDMDLLITIVREFIINNSASTKLILMSATLQTDIFIKYLTFTLQNLLIVPAVVKHKIERRFKIEKFFLDDLEYLTDGLVDYIKPGITLKLYQIAKDLITKLLKSNPKTILVFLPGIFEINAMHAVLKEAEDLEDSCLICVLHSSLSTADQKVAFMNAMKPKIVLSTNIAESSVTISDVSCVIDFCLTKLVSVNSQSAISSLQLEWAAKDSLEQRAGRTGRTCDGVVYRLVRRCFYNDRLKRFTTPEMQRCPLEAVVLRIKMLDIEPPAILLSKSISPPEASSITKAVMTLKELAALQRISDDGSFVYNDGKLTYVGRVMSALPLDVRVTKLIILGYIYSLLDEAIIISAGLNNKSIFRNSFHEKIEDYTHKLSWSDGSNCDFLAILNAYMLWKLMTEQGAFSDWKAEQKWCNQYNLERKSLHEMRQLILEIKNRLVNLKLENLPGEHFVSWHEKEKPLVLKICIAGAFIPNFFIAGESAESSEQDIHKQLGNKSPFNTVYFRNFDKRYVGEVYEEQIKQKIVEAGICRSTNNVKVSFDKGSTKFFVQFNNPEASVDSGAIDIACNYESGASLVSGNICPEVYKAVKVRSLGYRMTIDVMNSEDTEAFALKHGLIVETDGRTNRNFLKRPELCVLPLTCVKSLQGFVTHINHCGQFFIQPRTDENQEVLEKLDRTIEKEELENIKSIKDLGFNQLVLVQLLDVKKRGKVVGVNSRNQSVCCFLFDYGSTVEIPITEVYEVSKEYEEYFEVPERCFEASLSEIAPLTFPKGKWTAEAVNEFKKLALGKEVQIEVFSVVEEVASVKLWAEGVCVNETLIECGFAQQSEETFPRKHNNEIRQRIQSTRSNFYGPEVEFAEHLNKMLVVNCDSPPQSKCNLKLTVVGPISPLETSLSHILINFKPTEITVDPNSANSVLLIDDPANTYGRLIVAANITKNKNGLVLHETTLMPKIPGLPMILAMIFAPDVIFRRNVDKTKYSSLQFGLGYHKSDSSAFFAKNDCSLPVNFELTDQAFSDINQLRFLMSNLLMTEPNEQIPTLKDKEKSDLLVRVKNQLLKILNKNLQPVSSSSTAGDNEGWKTEDQKDAKVWKEAFIGGGTYHLIPQSPLYKLSAQKLFRIVKKVQELQNEIKTTQQGVTKDKSTYTCPLCCCSYEDTFSLQIHFRLNMHINQMKKLMTEENAREIHQNDQKEI